MNKLKKLFRRITLPFRLEAIDLLITETGNRVCYCASCYWAGGTFALTVTPQEFEAMRFSSAFACPECLSRQITYRKAS